MFEDYKVPADIAIRLEVEEVRKSIKNIFKAFECPDENAKHMADVLLCADIHGIDSNGIPYHPDVVTWHREMAEELGVEHCFGDA